MVLIIDGQGKHLGLPPLHVDVVPLRLIQVSFQNCCFFCHLITQLVSFHKAVQITRESSQERRSPPPHRYTDVKKATLDWHLSHGPNYSFLPIYRWNSLWSVLSCCILSSSWSWSMHTGHRETAYIYGTSRFDGWPIRPFWQRSIIEEHMFRALLWSASHCRMHRRSSEQ